MVVSKSVLFVRYVGIAVTLEPLKPLAALLFLDGVGAPALPSSEY